MAILLSDSIPSSNVDDAGNVEIAAPSGGDLELQDSTGTTQILLSDTGVSLAGGSLSASPVGVDANQLVTLHDGLVIEVDQTSDIPLRIHNSLGNVILQVDEDGDFMLAGAAVNEVVSSINEAQDNTKQLATVSAITSFVHTEASGTLAYEEFNTKAEFDTYLAQSEIHPAIVLAKDTTPFDYTDTGGNAQTGLTWWLGVVQKPIAGSLSTSALFHSNSQDSLTGPEISAALYAQADTNQYTDADQTAVQTISDKMDKTSSGVNLLIENPGNGNGYILFRNANAPTDRKDFALVSRSDGSFDFESRLDNGTVENRWTYEHEGDSYFPGAIFQGANQVLDTSSTTADVAPSTDRNYVSDSEASAIANLPANTTSALLGKFDSSLVTTNIKDFSGRVPDAPTVDQAIDAAIAAAGSTFDGGTINQNLIVASDNKDSVTLKADNNTSTYSGIAWQNTGSYYTASIHREPTDESDDLLINVGSSATLDAVPPVAKFKNDTIALEVTRGGIHAQGDIFAFNGGNMAAGTITAVAQFVSDTLRMNGSETDNNWALYKAAQGTSSGLGGTMAADGRNFSGQALRLRVANNTEQGFILENGFGLNLFEVEGSSGQATFAGQVNFLNDLVIHNKTINMNADSNGQGDLVFTHTTGTADQRNWKVFPNSNGYLEVRSVTDSLATVERFRFYHNGDFQVPGAITADSFAVTQPSTMSNTNLTISNPGTGNGYIEFNNSSASVNQERYKMYATYANDFRLESMNDAGVTQSAWEFKHNGDTHLPASLEVDGFISMFDSGGHEHRLEHGSDGITLRTLVNPDAGKPIFTIESSGNSKRLVVPHDGPITTSNAEIRVGTQSDGTGGHPVLTPNNIGDLVASYTYTGSFPTISQSLVTEWFQRMARVQFIGVGGGTINLPQIVGPETTPTSSQVIAGSTIILTNYNNGSNITLSRFNSGQTFMVDHLGNQQTSATLFWGTKIELQALDVRDYSTIPTNWCWGIKGY